MDNSTEGVTLLTVFIKDVMTEVEKENVDLTALNLILKDVNLKNLYEHVPITIYNDLCYWVETKLGIDILLRVGYNIGKTVFQALLENGIVLENPSALEVINGLEIAASSMINDSKERGWVILNATDNSIEMRRTQTFNSKLQLGLLRGLLEKAGQQNVKVSYLKSIENGDEFDDYLLTWE